MKLVRFGAKGSEKPGLVDADGKVRDLAGHVADITGETLAPKSLAKLARSIRVAAARARRRPSRGAGRRNAHLHRHRPQLRRPRQGDGPGDPGRADPLQQGGLGISGPFDDVIYPKNSDRMDWECEIAFVIGKRARYVDEKDALAYIAGYTICNDVSERRFQMKRNGQWVKGKSAETFGPLGPWLVTTDEIADPHNLTM